MCRHFDDRAGLLLLESSTSGQLQLAKYLQLKFRFSLEKDSADNSTNDDLINSSTETEKVILESSLRDAPQHRLDMGLDTGSHFIMSHLKRINDSILRLDERQVQYLLQTGETDKELQIAPSFLISQRVVFNAVKRLVGCLTSARFASTFLHEPQKAYIHALGHIVKRTSTQSLSPAVEVAFRVALRLGPTMSELANLVAILSNPQCRIASSGRPDVVNQHSSRLALLVKSLSSACSNRSALFSNFLQYISSLESSGTNMVAPGLKLLQRSSPGIVSNVFTPTGDYSLGFWIRVPRSLLGKGICDSDRDGKWRIHLLSRIPETGDFNLISLFSDASNSCDCNPSISLIVDDKSASLVVTVMIYSTNYVNRDGVGGSGANEENHTYETHYTPPTYRIWEFTIG